MNDGPCIKEGVIAKLIERVNNIATRQDRHHKWTNTVETDCRTGRVDDMKEIDTKFEKALEAVGKSRTAVFRMFLTIIIVFGTLLGAIAFLMANGK